MKASSFPPNLVHLGLGFNQLTHFTFGEFRGKLPRLLSLDLSFNRLYDLEHTLNQLQNIPSLVQLSLIVSVAIAIFIVIVIIIVVVVVFRYLILYLVGFIYIKGNPFCLLRSYRPRVIRALPQLQVLDDNKITPEELQIDVVPGIPIRLIRQIDR